MERVRAAETAQTPTPKAQMMLAVAVFQSPAGPEVVFLLGSGVGRLFYSRAITNYL